MRRFKWKNLGHILWICAVLLAGCEKAEDEQEIVDYQAGEIPGLGGADGELTGTPFQLPDGIELTEDITGAANQDRYWDFSAFYSAKFTARSFIGKDGGVETKSFAPQIRVGEEEDAEIHYYGSGYGFVDLLIAMHNNRSTPVTVTFPAATILRSQSGNCQNGVLIKKVTVTIPANSDYRLSLSFYCGNAHKSSAHSSDVYVLGVVSNARPLLDLCDRVKNKKINIEEFSRTSQADYDTYNDQVDRLQDIVWHVTDDDGLTEYDIEYINSLKTN
jgi:hypothetical protein